MALFDEDLLEDRLVQCIADLAALGPDPDSILKQLTEKAGFHRARYFHVSQADGDGTWLSGQSAGVIPKSLVVAAQATLDGHPRYPEGTHVPWAESSLQGLFPVGDVLEPNGCWSIADYGSSNDVRPHVCAEWGLKGRAWTEFLIATNRSAGVLSVDVQRSGILPLGSRVEGLLTVIARWLLGIYLNPPVPTRARVRRRDSGVFDRFARTLDLPRRVAADTREDQLASCYELLDSALFESRAALSSVFRYDWQTGFVTKVYEASIAELRPADFPERYPVGHRYTGLAFLDPSRRHIPDLGQARRLGELEPGIDNDSLERHDRIFGGEGKTRAALFQRFSDLSGGFLIRELNRADEPLLGFQAVRHRLDFVAKLLGTKLNEMEVDDLSAELSALAAAATAAPLEIKKLRLQVQAILAERQVTDVHYVISFGDSTTVWGVGADHAHRPIANLFRSMPFDKETWKHSRAVIRRAELPDDIAEILPESQGYLAFGIDKPVICIVFVPIPLTVTLDGRVHQRKDMQHLILAPTSDLLLLDTMPALFAMAHQSAMFYDAASNYGSGFARYLHHELLSRLARLANGAHASLSLASAELANNKISTGRVTNSAKEVRRLADELTRSLRPAGLLATDELELRFEPTSISTLVTEAAEEVLERFSPEFCVANDLKNFAIWMQALRPQAESTPDLLVCDGVLVKQALVAALDNAIKYSNPAYPDLDPSKPIETRTRLNRPARGYEWSLLGAGPNVRIKGGISIIELVVEWSNSDVVFSINNWGVPGPEGDTMWKIFQRGGANDPRRAIPGLGLGLFLVRLTSDTHLGQSRFASRPTLADEDRQFQEGYSSTVAFSVSRTLKWETQTINYEMQV